MSTLGDKVLDVSLSKIGEKSLFTKELEVALEDGRVDFVVHSLKDLPTTLPPGMILGAVTKRENPHDAVVMSPSNKDKKLSDLPAGSVIGTSSLRRIAQLKRKYPQFEYKDIRGNLNTRLAKLDDPEGEYAAIVLAVAGLTRIDLGHRITHILTPDESLHAVSQGALGVECRENDTKCLNLLASVNDYTTRVACTCERSFMRTLEGGCSVPIGVNTNFENGVLTLRGLVSSLDGQKVLEDNDQAAIEGTSPETDYEQANQLGAKVANALLAAGAAALLGR
ncbi:porphobilinogen deaminase [Hesseltinella vesiculosa]|uniref:hydroxymethylbilane synthase n=1 Tax=Hesseltinella vesiculosa TaxID=101127 RepID=A0A1X2GA48_9FUNG|nr:porphobilinogen deaminase [Hesseltinella vesiculosa]